MARSKPPAERVVLTCKKRRESTGGLAPLEFQAWPAVRRPQVLIFPWKNSSHTLPRKSPFLGFLLYFPVPVESHLQRGSMPFANAFSLCPQFNWDFFAHDHRADTLCPHAGFERQILSSFPNPNLPATESSMEFTNLQQLHVLEFHNRIFPFSERQRTSSSFSINGIFMPSIYKKITIG